MIVKKGMLQFTAIKWPKSPNMEGTTTMHLESKNVHCQTNTYSNVD